jgi:fused signal recognition particle receptor
MGLFDFFSKKKKEQLNEGLEMTKKSVFSKITKAIAGKSKVDDEVLDNLEEILVTSDVGVTTTLKIIERIEARVARDKYLGADELNSILKEEIAAIFFQHVYVVQGLSLSIVFANQSTHVMIFASHQNLSMLQPEGKAQV